MIQKARGFTIVELLIVIVVIGILATLSMVGYSGIQGRAKLAQQTADLDKIGKAIQLWSAENGKTLGQSGAGAGGHGYGSLAVSYSGLPSIDSLLREPGYLTVEIAKLSISNILLAPCTNFSDVRWAVIAVASPAPVKPVSQQITESGCTDSMVFTYTSGVYSDRNLVKAY